MGLVAKISEGVWSTLSFPFRGSKERQALEAEAKFIGLQIRVEDRQARFQERIESYTAKGKQAHKKGDTRAYQDCKNNLARALACYATLSRVLSRFDRAAMEMEQCNTMDLVREGFRLLSKRADSLPSEEELKKGGQDLARLFDGAGQLDTFADALDTEMERIMSATTPANGVANEFETEAERLLTGEDPAGDSVQTALEKLRQAVSDYKRGQEGNIGA